MRKRACPCQIAEIPCKPNCTCVVKHSSAGCLCCARYGSDEQRRAAANSIVEACQNYRAAQRQLYASVMGEDLNIVTVDKVLNSYVLDKNLPLDLEEL